VGQTHFISDMHFGHAKVIEYSQRPYLSVEDMDNQIRINWNRVVEPKDQIYILGDISFSSIERTVSLMQSLNGVKHLILGNHDKRISKRKDAFTGIFASVQNYLDISINNRFIVMSHFPFRSWDRQQYKSIHLHGHSHGVLPPLGNSVDVGIDAKFITKEYRPVSITEIFQFFEDTNGNS
jgi:calcineurin-like phosphoesterase family protein